MYPRRSFPFSGDHPVVRWWCPPVGRRFTALPSMNRILAVALICGIGCAIGCRPAGEKAPSAPGPSAAVPLRPLVAQPLGASDLGKPLIAHVAAIDLDGDGLLDVVACDAKANKVVWLRQVERGRFEETTLASGLNAPVHAEAVDLNGDGHLELLIACMGVVYPNNDLIGSIVILENDGHEHFTSRVVADRIARVTDVRAADFNGDGRLDLAVAQFGYDQGEVQWFEQRADGTFLPHPLISLPGAINVVIADFDGNHHPDIATLISQQSEEVVLLRNDGRGNFTQNVLFGSTNEDYGSSGMTLCDLNRDGLPDLLFTNGDGFDYAEPGARSCHGVQWLENLGDGRFHFHRIGDWPGAYSPVAVDFDQDGAMDVLLVSCYQDWTREHQAALVLFRNDGRMNFTPEPLAMNPTHLVCLTVGDFDGTGVPVAVTGGFHTYPPYEHMSRVSLWRPARNP